MSNPIYNDEAIIRGLTYSTNGGHKVSLELDPEGWERLKGLETTRCAMVLVPIQNDGTPDPDPKPFAPPKPKRRMSELSRAQQAGLYCNNPKFQQWIGNNDGSSAADEVRRMCRVTSRAELDTNDSAGVTWDRVRNSFDAFEGKIAGPEK